MTTSDQKSERQTLDAVLAALRLRPDQEPQGGETPDFDVCISGRMIGVEVTMYRSGATVEDGNERRPVESEWERLKTAADAFRTQRPELRVINVELMFKDMVPRGGFMPLLRMTASCRRRMLEPARRARRQAVNLLRTLQPRRDHRLRHACGRRSAMPLRR